MLLRFRRPPARADKFGSLDAIQGEVIRMLPSTRREVLGFLERCPWVALACSIFGAVALFNAGAAIAFGAVPMFLAGVFGAGLLLLSWRYRHPYWSWLIWAVPAPALLVLAFELTVAPLVITGAVSILSGIWAAGGFGGLGFFGSLFMLRRFVQRWLAI